MLKKLLIQFKPLFAWFFWITLLIVSYILLIEMQPSQSSWPYFDKVIHISMFLTLGVLGYIAYNKHNLIVWVGLIFFAAATEYLQSALTETRVGNIHDWLADVIGITLSLALVYFIQSIDTKTR